MKIRKNREEKEDGIYVIYYEFDESEGDQQSEERA